MPEESLRRLGGGRWQTRDGRFTIEPQAGTWVIVDGEQVDDLGLPLVRGPYRSLTSAREAIETARQEQPPSSPLAARVADAKRGGRSERGRGKTKGRHAAASEPSRSGSQEKEKAEPGWLTSLDPGAQRRARDIRRRLDRAGIPKVDVIVRAESVDGQPALARLAIQRRIRAAIEATPDGEQLAASVVRILVAGHDRELKVEWRLVDGDGRAIARLDIPEADQ